MYFLLLQAVMYIRNIISSFILASKLSQPNLTVRAVDKRGCFHCSSRDTPEPVLELQAMCSLAGRSAVIRTDCCLAGIFAPVPVASLAREWQGVIQQSTPVSL